MNPIHHQFALRCGVDKFAVKLVTLALLLAFVTSLQAADQIVGLRFLAGADSNGAAGVSADGSVVVGNSFHSGGVNRFYPSGQAMRWTSGGGMAGLGALAAGEPSSAAGVSADGSVVVGTSFRSRFGSPGNPPADPNAFRWTAGGGMAGLGFLSGANTSAALGVSADGTVVVGASGNQAFRWTSVGGMTGLGMLPGAVSSSAAGSSADGAVVVGTSTIPVATDAGVFFFDHAFRWTPGGGMIGLGLLPGNPTSVGSGVSADGSVVVGTSGNQAFRWTAGNGMAGLGFLAGDTFSEARGVSGDGAVVVGSSTPGLLDDRRAFRWTQSAGMQSVADWLAGAGVMLPSGWVLQIATATNQDGSVVVGSSPDPGGTFNARFAWLARVGGAGSGIWVTGKRMTGADLNGDGKGDLVWFNAATGETYVWLMDGTGVVSQGSLYTHPVWKVIATPDLDGDGKSDLVWHNAATGETYAWLMNGTGVASQGGLFAHPDWKVVATPDLDGDGRSDLVWHNAATGETTAWLMNGTGVASQGGLFTHPDWKVIATPDLDSDGRSDLVWYNAASGETYAWLMNGMSVPSQGSLYTDPDWKVLATPDLNGDGRGDLLWHNAASGETYVWLMNGTSVLAQGSLFTHPEWKVIATPDMNGDGKSDLVWYNAATGETYAWLMDGTGVLSQMGLFTDPNWMVTGF